MSVLQVKGLSRAFGGIYAVNNVSFEVNAGEILSIIGPNGAGKTTLFNLITRIYDVTEGNIFFEGRKITKCAPYKLAGMGMSRTFQNIELFEGLTTLENVMVGGYISGKIGFAQSLSAFRNRVEERRLKTMALEKIRLIGLDDYVDAEAVEMPYGIQRMIEVARALMTSPKVLLLDEPTAGLNSVESQELSRTLLHLRNEGMSVVLIEHDMETVMNVSDRIIVINYGEKLAEGTPLQIRQNQEVISAYLGEEIY